MLLRETVDGLNIRPDGIYVDGTLGGGGHSLEIAKRLTAGGHLYGIDRDMDAIEAASDRLKDYSDRFTAMHGNFYNAAEMLKAAGVDKIGRIYIGPRSVKPSA